MEMQNSLLNCVKEIRKVYSINQVNKLLRSGWILLTVEQQKDSIDLSVVTSYILGRIEELKENAE